MQLSQASVLVQVSEEERYREWTLNSDQCLQSEGTNGKYMSPRLVSVSAIVVNEGGWCSGKNIKSGSKKQGFRTQLCHKDILGLWASLLNPPHRSLSLFFFFLAYSMFFILFLAVVILFSSNTASDSEGPQSKLKHNLLPSGQYRCFICKSSYYHPLVASKIKPRYVAPSSHYPLLLFILS